MAIIPSVNWSVGLVLCLLAQVFVFTSGGAIPAKLEFLEDELFTYNEEYDGEYSSLGIMENVQRKLFYYIQLYR